MKKLIVLLAGMIFWGGCYLPYPSVGVRPPQVVETWEEVCTTKVNKKGVKKTHCRWARSR